MTRMKKITFLNTILFLSAALLTGCQTNKPETNSPQKTILTLSLDAEVSTLDAQAAIDSASFDVIGCLMEGLYTIDAQGNPLPAMAQSAEKSDDGLIYIFHLRDASWSDGSPVTADDFVFGWQRAVEPENANENSFMIGIGGVKNADDAAAGRLSVEELGITALDEKTLRVELDRPVAYFESLLAFPSFYPAKRELIERTGASYGASPADYVSNGPFVLTSYEPAATAFSLAKNESYWDKEHVTIDNIQYQVVKDSQQALMAYENGDLDVAVISGEQALSYHDKPDYHPVSLGSLWYLSPNQKVKGLDNLNLRMALALSFDKNAITSDIMKDGSVPADFAVPALLSNGPDGTDFRDGAKRYLETDKQAAVRYWEAAKKELGISELTLRLLIEDTEIAGNIGQFLQSEIAGALPGITVELEPVPKKIRLSRMQTGDYEIGLTRWGADYADPVAFLGMWTTNSTYNYGAWSNAQYDAIIDSATRGALAGDPAKRFDALHEAESIVMSEAVIFPVCEKSNAVLINPKVTGIEYHTVGVNRIFKNARKTQ